MKIKYLLIFLTLSLFACQSEPKEEAQSENTPTTEAPEQAAKSSPAEGKLKQINGSEVLLENGEKIALDAEDGVTLFLLRHGETMDGRTSLSGPGRVRTGKVSELFLGKKLSQVYADGNASMQTALAAAKGSEDVPFGLIQMDGTDAFAKTLLTNFKGNRVMMALTAENLEVLLNQLTGKTIEIPQDEYDNVFVLSARNFGDADVSHLKY